MKKNRKEYSEGTPQAKSIEERGRVERRHLADARREWKVGKKKLRGHCSGRHRSKGLLLDSPATVLGGMLDEKEDVLRGFKSSATGGTKKTVS